VRLNPVTLVGTSAGGLTVVLCTSKTSNVLAPGAIVPVEYEVWLLVVSDPVPFVGCVQAIAI